MDIFQIIIYLLAANSNNNKQEQSATERHLDELASCQYCQSQFMGALAPTPRNSGSNGKFGSKMNSGSTGNFSSKVNSGSKMNSGSVIFLPYLIH